MAKTIDPTLRDALREESELSSVALFDDDDVMVGDDG